MGRYARDSGHGDGRVRRRPVAAARTTRVTVAASKVCEGIATPSQGTRRIARSRCAAPTT